MLRRKLILNLGPMLVLLLIASVVAIVLLQGVLRRMDRVNRQAWTAGEDVTALSIAVHSIELNLYELRRDERRPLDELITTVDEAQQLLDRIGREGIAGNPEAERLYRQIQDALPGFRRHVSALATTRDPNLAHHHHDLTLAGATAMRQSIGPLSEIIQDHAHREQDALSAQFRWVVLGLSITFLVLINISVVLLLRLGRMVLRPVGALVEASRQLGNENLHYRVTLDADDEFGQLALAYNQLAERLQANEQRKMETLQQVALAMNHELNNVISIITLQLRLAGRQAPGNAALESCLKQIQGSLSRMADSVQMLKNVRRIVLTDYMSGMKMLDLRRSAEESDVQPPAEAPVEAPSEAHV
jgi:HAMP domain-containing protein